MSSRDTPSEKVVGAMLVTFAAVGAIVLIAELAFDWPNDKEKNHVSR